MQLGFCLFKYFPFGGLQRDCLRIALACQALGHKIRIYTQSWEGEVPPDFDLVYVPVKGLSSPAKNRAFVRFVAEHRAAHPLDLLIGFNKIPGLDCYYAADGCFSDKAKQQSGVWRWLNPRFWHFYGYERAIFGAGAQTQILMISKPAIGVFQREYGTESTRMHLLPPGISRDRAAPANAAELRQAFRREWGLADDQFLWLMVGSGFKTKGVDRALRALAALPDAQRVKTRLFVIGQDNPKPFQQIASKLGVSDCVQFFPGRNDIPHFLLGADLLVHPAYHENAGMVLLEALVAGLPVLVTAVCGYAHYIAEAQAGCVLATPFSQQAMNRQLQSMMQPECLAEWQRNALAYAAQTDLFSMPEVAAQWIDQFCAVQAPQDEARVG